MDRVRTCSVLVAYDGTARAERLLRCALAHCAQCRARLGVAIVPPPYAMVALPWAGASILQPCDESRRELLKRIPADVSVRFVVCSYPIGTRQVAELARRLECDSVLLPQRGMRLRLAERALTRLGLGVLNRYLDAPRPSSRGHFQRLARPRHRSLSRRTPVARATQ